MSNETPLIASIVLYHPDRTHLEETLVSLHAASLALGPERVRLVLVDNGGGARAVDQARLTQLFPSVEWISGQGNVGFGAGHNLALLHADAPNLLVLNPDVRMAPDALVRALQFMEAHPDCGLLSPQVFEDDGSLQYLCKRMPSVFDLFLRGLAPAFLRSWFHGRLAYYEMQDLIGDGKSLLWDPPIVTGCFMLFRSSVYRALGGFDERYFLYFEDFDISLRAARRARLAYVPQVSIVHHGGDAASKGAKHRRLFVRSALTFFRRHGWRLA